MKKIYGIATAIIVGLLMVTGCTTHQPADVASHNLSVAGKYVYS